MEAVVADLEGTESLAIETIETLSRELRFARDEIHQLRALVTAQWQHIDEATTASAELRRELVAQQDHLEEARAQYESVLRRTSPRTGAPSAANGEFPTGAVAFHSEREIYTPTAVASGAADFISERQSSGAAEGCVATAKYRARELLTPLPRQDPASRTDTQATPEQYQPRAPEINFGSPQVTSWEALRAMNGTGMRELTAVQRTAVAPYSALQSSRQVSPDPLAPSRPVWAFTHDPPRSSPPRETNMTTNDGPVAVLLSSNQGGWLATNANPVPTSRHSLRVDPLYSHGISISAQGHVGLSMLGSEKAMAAFTEIASSGNIAFEVEVRSKSPASVEIGFSAFHEIPTLSSASSTLMSEELTVLVSGRNELRVRGNVVPLVIRPPNVAPGQVLHLRMHLARNPLCLLLEFSGQPPLTVQLPSAFCRVPMCPVVFLPSLYDEVLARSL